MVLHLEVLGSNHRKKNQGEELYKRPAFVLIPRFIVYYIYVCMYVTIYKE